MGFGIAETHSFFLLIDKNCNVQLLLKKAFLTVVSEITTATARFVCVSKLALRRLPQISHFSFNSTSYA